MKLEIDLVPSSAWGQSLRAKMGRSRWDKLRTEVLADQGNKCAICASTRKLQCHEQWRFDESTGIQRLIGFQAICSLCHLGSHIGLAENLAAEGHANIADIIRHYMKVNGVTKKQFETHKAHAFALWEKRSERSWKLDLGQWQHLAHQ